jgi:hypothetical protein
VLATIIFPTARVAAVEGAIEPPAALTAVFPRGYLTIVEGLKYLVSFIAWDVLLNIATIASRRNWNLTAATKARVTFLGTEVFSAGEQVPTHLLTAPSIAVICLAASLFRRVLPTEARLAGSHEITGRARASVAE